MKFSHLPTFLAPNPGARPRRGDPGTAEPHHIREEWAGTCVGRTERLWVTQLFILNNLVWDQGLPQEGLKF